MRPALRQSTNNFVDFYEVVRIIFAVPSASPAKPVPTASEMEILEVLWSGGPATVRQVHEALQDRRGTGYTTILKLMQIMAGKGLLERDESSRSHVYAPTVAREAVQGSMLGDLIDRVFRGSTSALVMRALASRRASPDELAQIRELLADIDGQGEGEP